MQEELARRDKAVNVSFSPISADLLQELLHELVKASEHCTDAGWLLEALADNQGGDNDAAAAPGREAPVGVHDALEQAVHARSLGELVGALGEGPRGVL
ncbi:MAG: hypothetical protein LJE69_09350 [Thiohalocapsa sp.]|jgi:hypothetical protein|uniref:hypothetical protein n=1 Tax=Thiohalocapsa sp. TaxID=2497641 RepID=UPI0025E3D5E4|nr:hypothetical protein [Thiohalocapsa sp.]MCG6941443.1 hypothetical protein [Thiohalocapsa sp.]